MERAALFCVQRGWWTLAAWMYRDMLRRDPRDADLEVLLAQCEAQRGNHDEALRLLGRRQSGAAVLVRVVIATQQSRFDDALTQIDDFLRRGAEDAEYGEVEALRQPIVEALEARR